MSPYKIAATQNMHVAFAQLAIINESSQLGMWNLVGT